MADQEDVETDSHRHSSSKHRRRSRERDSDRSRGHRDREHESRRHRAKSEERSVSTRHDRDRRDGRPRHSRSDRDSGRDSSRDRKRDRDRDKQKDLSRGSSRKDAEFDRSDRDRNVKRQSQSRSASPSQPPEPEKQKPNFGQSGKLAAETNTVNGIVLKYSEPAEARPPPATPAWHIFIFKDGAVVEMVELVQRSCWLVGRERQVADLPVDHPSCSAQHAAIQFRFVTKTNEFGEKSSKISPYIIDLESSNGTSVNGDKIPPSRFVELQAKDLIQFGHSSREYVLMRG